MFTAEKMKVILIATQSVSKLIIILFALTGIQGESIVFRA